MHSRIPVRLRKEPLFEAVWEIRFTGTKAGVADLLPGLIFKELSHKYSNIVKLPAANIPDPIVESDPKLKYVPKIRIENANQAVQIGEHAVSLSCRRPYSGWPAFYRYKESRKHHISNWARQGIRSVFTEIYGPDHVGADDRP